MLNKELFDTANPNEIKLLIQETLDASRLSYCTPNPLPHLSEAGLSNSENIRITNLLIEAFSNLLSCRENLEKLLGEKLENLDKDSIIKALILVKGKLLWADIEGKDISLGETIFQAFAEIGFPPVETEAETN